ncbi:hypothetical protein [Actinomadura flavalba]|uniref:hypothetical protein n=1 Tax=Actinomadura flavalba TaxID=1120938 RepID=UPI0003611859|nr:hypothetical protein [Actinomadura flavalba]
MADWFTREITDAGRLRLFLFFAAFIVTWLFIRFSVRMIRARIRWWPGNVTPGGRHIHHVVFGLVFMCVGGVGGLAVADETSGWAGFFAAVLGAGTALVLDEFALVLNLQDVYWSPRGRLSVQVVFVAIAIVGLLLVGLRPLGLDELGAGGEAVANVTVVLLVNLTLSVVTLLKGKVWTGLLGLFIGLFSIVGAIRLARPGSPWALRRYPEDSRKLARAQRRERRLRGPIGRFGTHLGDLIAGRPTPGE